MYLCSEENQPDELDLSLTLFYDLQVRDIGLCNGEDTSAGMFDKTQLQREHG